MSDRTKPAATALDQLREFAANSAFRFNQSPHFYSHIRLGKTGHYLLQFMSRGTTIRVYLPPSMMPIVVFKSADHRLSGSAEK
jgi:hypothetical protein